MSACLSLSLACDFEALAVFTEGALLLKSLDLEKIS